MKYPKSREEIRKVVEEVFSEKIPRPERQFKLFMMGTREEVTEGMRQFDNAMKKAANEWSDDIQKDALDKTH